MRMSPANFNHFFFRIIRDHSNYNWEVVLKEILKSSLMELVLKFLINSCKYFGKDFS